MSPTEESRLPVQGEAIGGGDGGAAVGAKLGAANGQLWAWLSIAIVNAILIQASVPMPRTGLRTRLAHHAFAAGHAVALGLLSAALVDVWLRVRPRPAAADARRIGAFVRGRALDVAVLAAASIAIGFAVLADDLGGMAGRIAGVRAHAQTPILIALVSVVSLGVPAAALVGRLLDRPWLRWLGFLAPIGGAIANHIVLPNDYPGAHFFLLWAAAVCGGASIAGLVVPKRSSHASPRPTRHLGRFAVACVAATSLVVWPGAQLMLELYKTAGAIVAPFRARIHADTQVGARGSFARASKPWFEDRARAPAVPPAAPPRSPMDRIVLLLVVDSLRADVMAGGKYATSLPTLTAMSNEGVDFTSTRSPGSQTVYSFSAIFASRYFSQMYWTQKPPDGLWPHRDTSPRFPELLAQAGIPTVTFASTRWLINEFGAAKGFTEETVVNPDTTREAAPSAEELTTPAIERLKRHGAGPLFMFLHYMDAHFPYDRASTSGAPFARYVAELGLVDKEIGRIRTELAALGMADRTTILVTADHGEAFGEHGTTQHGVTLYEELIRVPLLVTSPGAAPRRVAEPVSLVDVGPTVLDLMGLPTPGTYMGQSLVPFLLPGTAPKLARPIAAEGRMKQVLVLPEQIKVIRDQRKGTMEIYDLVRDPRESRNLYKEDEPKSEGRADVLREFFRVQGLRRAGYKVPYRP